jgi:hypothetical protein
LGKHEEGYMNNKKAPGRPAWTHKFGLNREGLIKELFHGAPAPTMEEIIILIPEGKRILIKI